MTEPVTSAVPVVPAPTGEPAPLAAPVARNGSDPRMYSEEELNNAREQERSKLYRRIETAEQKAARLEADAQEREALATAEATRVAAEARAVAEADMSAKDLLAAREAEWRTQFSTLESQIAAERALRERETEYASLSNYRASALEAARDDIAPEFVDLVSGNTQEEIDASILDMAARTARIYEQMQGVIQTTRQQMPGTRVTTPASGTDNSADPRTYTAEQIRDMPLSEYAKNRHKLIPGAVNGGPNARGLFG